MPSLVGRNVMAKHTRFLFGWTLTNRLDDKGLFTFISTSPPAVQAGRIYFNGQNLMVCEDGTKFYIATTS